MNFERDVKVTFLRGVTCNRRRKLGSIFKEDIRIGLALNGVLFYLVKGLGKGSTNVFRLDIAINMFKKGMVALNILNKAGPSALFNRIRVIYLEI